MGQRAAEFFDWFTSVTDQRQHRRLEVGVDQRNLEVGVELGGQREQVRGTTAAAGLVDSEEVTQGRDDSALAGTTRGDLS